MRRRFQFRGLVLPIAIMLTLVTVAATSASVNVYLAGTIMRLQDELDEREVATAKHRKYIIGQMATLIEEMANNAER